MRSLLPTIVLACALPLATAAQTLADNYIELTVTDTVPMRVKSITYNVTAQDPDADKVTYDDNTDYDKVQREQAGRQQKATDRLRKDLEGQHYSVTVAAMSEEDPYTVSNYAVAEANTSPVTLAVTVKDESELKKLVQWLRQRGGVDGSIGRWEYDQPAAATTVMAALFAKAHEQAQQLATLGGRKLGKLLQVQDPQQNAMTFQDFLKLMTDRDRDTHADAMLRMPLRSLVFRFALTD